MGSGVIPIVGIVVTVDKVSMVQIYLWHGIRTNFSQLQFIPAQSLDILSGARYRIVVFPAASRPTIKIRISTKSAAAHGRHKESIPFLPNKPDNNFETMRSVYMSKKTRRKATRRRR